MSPAFLHRSAGRLSVLAVVSAAALASAAPAMGAQRYASPTSTDAIGACTALAPCRVDHAINDAAAGDDVVVQPGTYKVENAIDPGVAVNVHGVEGQPRPRLIGSSNIATDLLTLDAGGTLSHLYVEVNKDLMDAIDIAGVVAEDLVLFSPVGVGATVRGSSAGTVLRDSVVYVTGTSPAIEVKDSKTVGSSEMLNVTAIASNAGAAAVKAKQGSGTAVARNSIFRGGSEDVHVYSGATLALDHSNFRPGSSFAYKDAGWNQSAEPLFAAAREGDFREAAGSPTINAGTSADDALGVADPQGVSRAFGGAPDIGAYEYSGADQPPVKGGDAGSGDSAGDNSTSGGSGTDLAPPAPPKAGKRLGVGEVKGKVRVQVAGSSRFVELDGDASIPVNSTIDASKGMVALTSARDSKGTPQTGQFWGGTFKVLQRAGGTTELRLSGGSFAACRKPRAKGAQAAKARFVRRLWGKDRRGRFRTRGRRAQATVRGTRWLTEDRCDGTRFVVKEGAIAVRANGARRSRLVRAGQSYLARAKR